MLPRGSDKLALLALLLLGFLLAGLVFLYLWQGAILGRLRAERAALALAVEELRWERSFLEHKLREAYSPEVLSERAKALGMGPLDLSRVRFLVIADENGD
jgi:hypothetical protein